MPPTLLERDRHTSIIDHLRLLQASGVTLIGREYLRVSRDRSGREKSNSEQHVDLDGFSVGLGFALHPKPYSDRVSASRYSTKTRDDWERLIADLKADRFEAHGLMLWESSRGSRKVSEWMQLIELCELRNVVFGVYLHGRLLDPSNERDVRTLLEDAIDAQYESGKTSKRVRRARVSEAAEGAIHGVVPYGYKRIYDEKTRKPIDQVPHPTEGPRIKELFARIIKGHSIRRIERNWIKRGILSRNGKVLSSAVLGEMARRPVYAGLRVYEGRTVKGKWTEIVSPETFYSAQRILDGNARRVMNGVEPHTFRHGRAVHFLPSLAECGVCRSTLIAKPRKSGEDMYGCKRGCVSISEAGLDKLVTGLIIGYLSRPDVYDAIVARDGNAVEELKKVRTELAELRARHDALSKAVADGTMSVMLAAKAEPEILAGIASAEKRDQELSTPSELRGILEPGADIEKRWNVAPLEARRKVAQLLLTPQYVGGLQVMRAPVRGKRAPVAERVMWRRERDYDSLPGFEAAA